MEQSPDTVHLMATQELMNLLETTNITYTLDTRPKIEDLDLFKLRLQTEVDQDTYNKFTTFLDNYLKFYNK